MTKFEALREQALRNALSMGKDRVYMPITAAKYAILPLTWEHLEQAIHRYILLSPVGTELPHMDMKRVFPIHDDCHDFIGCNGFHYRDALAEDGMAPDYHWMRTEDIHRNDIWKRVE